jgi:glycine cleavage system transcriptional repressor
MTRHFVVSAVGGDRPGIVAGVTAALTALDCNREDTSMTVLRGRFAMVLLVAGPDSQEAAALEAGLGGPVSEMGLAVWVHDVAETVPTTLDGESWTIAVHGADRHGLVSGVSAALVDLGANIVELSTRLVGTDRPLYAMLVEVMLPAGTSGHSLQTRLDEVAGELGVTASAHPSSADIL